MPEAHEVEAAELERVERRAREDDEPVAPARERLGVGLEREAVVRPRARAPGEGRALLAVRHELVLVVGCARAEHAGDLVRQPLVAEDHRALRRRPPVAGERRQVRDDVVEVVVEGVARVVLEDSELRELVDELLDLGGGNALGLGDLGEGHAAVEAAEDAVQRSRPALVGERERQRVPRPVPELEHVGAVRDDREVTLQPHVGVGRHGSLPLSERLGGDAQDEDVDQRLVDAVDAERLVHLVVVEARAVHAPDAEGEEARLTCSAMAPASWRTCRIPRGPYLRMLRHGLPTRRTSAQAWLVVMTSSGAATAPRSASTASSEAVSQSTSRRAS